jgi:DNA-binding SARP family transcriptional activator
MIGLIHDGPLYGEPVLSPDSNGSVPTSAPRDARGANGTAFVILGPLSASTVSPGQPVEQLELGPFKQRALLGMLLCRAGTVVSVDELTDTLWWERPPRTAHKNIQVYISHLRHILPSSTIRFRPPGYLISVEPGAVDAMQFEQLVRRGRSSLREGHAAEAAEQLGAALQLWTGPALADLTLVPALRAEAQRWEERRLGVYEDWMEAKLSLSEHVDILDALEALVALHPLRERLRSLQMTALYRYGRQAEALAEYDNLRRALASELGLQPTPALQRLYHAVLTGDRSLDLGDDAPAPELQPAEEPEVVAHATTPLATPPIQTLDAPEPPSIRLSLLPRDIDDFIGRDKELAALLDAFDPFRAGGVRRLVAITGPPGVGKTALAVHAAHLRRASFPDGALLVSLRSEAGYLPRRAVLETLLDLLGVSRADLPDNEESRAAVLRDRLSSRRVLLILDDAADERHVRGLLPGSGPSAVIATSQRRLGGLESANHIVLAPFSNSESRVFLARIVGAKRTGNATNAVDRIVHACGALPLAVRIAGERLASRTHVSLDRFAARLDDQRLLDELSVGDLEMRASVKRYVDELCCSERSAVIRLGLLPDGEISVAQVAALLEDLVDAHAVVPLANSDTGELRCVMPNPLRVYARECAYRDELAEERHAALARLAAITAGTRPSRLEEQTTNRHWVRVRSDLRPGFDEA